MSSYTTKFSLNDTAYFVDSTTLNVVSGTVRSIYVIDNYLTPTEIAYSLSFSGNYSRSKTKYTEDELYYLAEAKAQVLVLLAQRTSDIESLG